MQGCFLVSQSHMALCPDTSRMRVEGTDSVCVSASPRGARPRKELRKEKHKGEAKADCWVAVIAVLVAGAEKKEV